MADRRVVVLIDGSNVARCPAWRRHGDAIDDADLRRRLVDAVCSWASSHGYIVVVAFDGAGPWRPGTVQVSPDVDVVGSGGIEGDDVLERFAALHRRARHAHWLVTSDGALRHVAGAGADRVVHADDFVAELVAPPVMERDKPPAGPALSQLGDTVSDEVRTALERMRRGDA